MTIEVSRLHSALVVVAAGLMLTAACKAMENGMERLPEIPAAIKRQLTFNCTFERDLIPPHDPEAEQLYKRARFIIKGNILKRDAHDYPVVERLLRIAIAYGHDKANIELRDMLEEGHANSPDPVNESIDLVQDLIRRGIPSGYYGMGWYLEHGYGMRAERELSFKYYRKSADMGSPEGQYLVGELLADISKTGIEVANIGFSMWACAAKQRHAKAANLLAVHRQGEGKYPEAMKYYQIGASEGLSVSALSLSDAFSEKDHADPTWGLGQAADVGRQSRYKTIQKFLSDYDYLNATVRELDEIVPLPPAALPSWNGKFKWLEEHKANVPPPLPSEERIAEMARAKGLDTKTGRQMNRLSR